MKVILSRKGFDAGYGGFPSPILPDGKIISLPIPDNNDLDTYASLLATDNLSYLDLMKNLGDQIRLNKETVPFSIDARCHLDPDIHTEAKARQKNWRGVFGQVGAVQGHLDNQGVDVGDLFLFFGWFREAKLQDGAYQFRKGVPNRHVIYGYLQVDEKIPLSDERSAPAWLDSHPHLHRLDKKGNTLYIARKTTSWNKKTPGWGTFRFDAELVLTKEGLSRSRWNLPRCFRDVPECFRDTLISYHSNKNWKDGYFQSAMKGQEFVVQDNPTIEEWARRLIRKYA